MPREVDYQSHEAFRALKIGYDCKICNVSESETSVEPSQSSGCTPTEKCRFWMRRRESGMDVMIVSGMDAMIVMIVREGYKSWEKARVKDRSELRIINRADGPSNR